MKVLFKIFRFFETNRFLDGYLWLFIIAIHYKIFATYSTEFNIINISIRFYRWWFFGISLKLKTTLFLKRYNFIQFAINFFGLKYNTEKKAQEETSKECEKYLKEYNKENKIKKELYENYIKQLKGSK